MTAPVLVTPAASPDPGVIAEAAAALRAGGVVGIPTDTVYGLAVDPRVEGAAARIFAVKRRPRDVVLAVLVAGGDEVDDLATGVGPDARRLMAAWWPGPLTVVLDRRPGLGVDLGSPGATIGLRCPAHAVARALAAAVGPIATTSANRHGRPPATTAAALVADLEGVDLVVDAGTCDGVPSTVLDCTVAPVRVLRPGPVTEDEIRATLQGVDGAGP